MSKSKKIILILCLLCVSSISSWSQEQNEVITALGIQQQTKELGYAISVINGKELTVAENPDVISALIGKVSGLQINVSDGSLNPDIRVNLRGSRSITTSNQAMLVLNGIPTDLSFLSGLNPNDIENIFILKGGNAAALYGSYAANGVLYVTTKKGTSHKPRVTYQLSTSFEKAAYLPEVQKRFGAGFENVTTGFPEYIALENQQYGPEFDGGVVPIPVNILKDPENDPNTSIPYFAPYRFIPNGREHFYQTGVIFQNSLSYSSGNENSNLFVSYMRRDQTGIIKHDKNTVHAINLNVSKRFNRFNVSLITSYLNSDINITNADNSGIYHLYSVPGNYDMKDFENWRNAPGATLNDYATNQYYSNPWALIELYRRDNKTDKLTGNVKVDYQILDWLKFQLRGGLSISDSKSKITSEAVEYTPFAKRERAFAERNRLAYLKESTNYSNRVSLDFMAFFEKKLSENLNINAVAGWSINDRLQIDDSFDDEKIRSRENSTSIFFGSVRFNYKGWAFIETVGRNDRRSFAYQGRPMEVSTFYPGVNASFILSDAIPSIKNNFISYLKLRTAYAETGIVTGEHNTEIEAGAEFGFLNNKIVLETTVYKQSTDDIPWVTDEPYRPSGVFVYMGKMVGKGIELDLRLAPLWKTKDFEWNFLANFTMQTSTVNELFGGLDDIAYNSSYHNFVAKIGKPYPWFKATDWLRDPQGRVIVNANTGYPSTSFGLADIGRMDPKYILGLNSRFKWKNLEFSITADYRGGHMAWFQQEDIMLFQGTSYISAIMGRQRFVFPNSVIYTAPDDTYIPNTNITTMYGGNNFWIDVYGSVISPQIVSANSWKIREVSLRYSLPESIISKTKIFQSIAVSLVGRNIALWTPKTNHWGDPDMFTSGDSNIPGYQTMGKSATRSYGFAVSVAF